MSVLSIPNSFSPNTVIQSSQVNANYSAIATEYNAHAVQTDVAKTITVSHTFAAAQTFQGGITVGGGSGVQVSSGGITVFAGGITVIGTTHLLTSTEGSVSVQSTASARVVLSIAGNTARASYLQLSETSVADRWAIGVNAGDSTLRFKVGLPTSGDIVTITSVGGINATSMILTAGSGPILALARTDAAAIMGHLAIQRGGANKAYLGLDASDNFALLNAAQNAANVTVTDAGNVTVRGNLTVTGSISAVTGSNSYVRRTSDLTFTVGSDSTLTFAIGATEEWEAEYKLFHTNASAATLTVTAAGPASVTLLFGGFDGVNANASAVVGGAQTTSGNSIVSFTMNATMGFSLIHLYAKGGGTGGNVTLSLAASAGTGTLKTGSLVRYSRIT